MLLMGLHAMSLQETREAEEALHEAVRAGNVRASDLPEMIANVWTRDDSPTTSGYADGPPSFWLADLPFQDALSLPLLGGAAEPRNGRLTPLFARPPHVRRGARGVAAAAVQPG